MLRTAFEKKKWLMHFLNLSFYFNNLSIYSKKSGWQKLMLRRDHFNYFCFKSEFLCYAQISLKYPTFHNSRFTNFDLTHSSIVSTIYQFNGGSFQKRGCSLLLNGHLNLKWSLVKTLDGESCNVLMVLFSNKLFI